MFQKGPWPTICLESPGGLRKRKFEVGKDPDGPGPCAEPREGNAVRNLCEASSFFRRLKYPLLNATTRTPTSPRTAVAPTITELWACSHVVVPGDSFLGIGVRVGGGRMV